MKNVVAYIRVSTDKQAGDDKFGLEYQKEQITEYCNKNGLNISRWICDEGESGAKERPGFDEIVYGDVSNPPHEAVVVAKNDRVAREIEVYYYYKMLLRKKSMELISVTEDFGREGMMKDILEMFTIVAAKMERENINKRTSGGRKVKAAKGGYSGGRPPYGYSAHKGMLVINEKEAIVVRYVFELKRKGSTYQQIADALNEAAYTNRSGSKFSISTLQVILGNEPLYKGKYRYGKTKEWVDGQHEAILKGE